MSCKILLIFTSVFVLFLTALFPMHALANKPDIPSKILTIYSKPQFQGESVHLNVTDCTTLTLGNNFKGPPSSVILHDGDCFHLYQDEDCTSESVVIKPGTPALDNLARWNEHHNWTNDKIKAAAPCEDECSPNKINLSQSEKMYKTSVTLYPYEQKRGGHKVIKVEQNACTLIPLDFRRIASSIEITNKDCIELHANWNCSGHSIQLKNTFPSHFLASFAEWNFTKKAMSVSTCDYRCFVIASSRNTTTPQTEQSPPWPNAVTLFPLPSYKGHPKNLNLTDECQNLTGRWTWREGTQSIKSYGGCINVFEEFGCDNKTGKYTHSKGSIPFLDYNYGIKSIKRCKMIENPSNNNTSSSKIEIETEESYFLLIAYVVIPLAVAFILIGFLITIAILCTRKGYVEMLNPKEIQDFRDGLDLPVTELNGDLSLLQQSRPYDQRLEISKKYITVDKNSILGEGEFGIVHRGHINPPGLIEPRVVAIKSVKPYCQLDYVRTMLKEIKTMIYVGKHPNIVSLVGCYTQNLQNSELFILTELCENGSLERFLQSKQQSFVNLFDIEDLLGDQELLNSTNYTNSSLHTNGKLNTIHLLQWSLQIAQGMEHLESKMVIHGDLAIRNILLDESFKAKISDFGLSQQLYTKMYYTKRAQAPMPWRSMAIEALRNLKFSTQSDIWAYGITLWEIFALGDMPFPGRVWSNEFLDELISGLRPPKPKYTSTEMYELMQSCWKANPEERKSFSNLRKNLDDLLTRYLKPFPETSSQYFIKVQEDLVSFNCELQSVFM